MPLIERTKETMRTEFVNRVLAHEKSKSALCREYGISRPTGDDWIKRYLAGESLADKSHAPNNPNKTPPDIEKLVVDKRKQYPAFGAKKIKKILSNEGYSDIPSDKTINNIFHRNGLITKQASLNATPTKRFEKSYPNEMWQADYKGNFLMKDNTRCHPLNIVDDYSRFNICCEACKGETFDEIKPIMIKLFNEYGQPFSFLCDNGNPWGTAQSTGFTRFEVWLMEHGILVIHGRALHPQTQGKDERFNGSFTRECLKLNEFENLSNAQQIFDDYRYVYNHIRPHMALDLSVPAERYKKSNREYNPVVEPWEYPKEYETRMVKSSGYITIGGQGYFLSEAFANKEIAVRESHKAGCISLFFRQFRIGRINVDKRTFDFKKIYLINNDPRHEKA